MNNITFEITVDRNGKHVTNRFDGSGECALFSLSVECTDDRVRAVMTPKEPLVMVSAAAVLPLECRETDRILLNGYQTWTDTRELTVEDRMIGLRRTPRLAVKLLSLESYGDYDMVKYSGKKGELHGFSYGYVRSGESCRFFGSMSEREGYTILRYSAKRGRLSICRECDGYIAKKPLTIADFAVLEGGCDEVFRRWFNMMQIPKPRTRPMSGYTSWYNHYSNINEKIIADCLEGMKRLPVKADLFQIDDGYESAVGDWLDVDKKKFPNGLKHFVDEAHSQGLLAGLWLAPFVCERKSRVFREHPDWIRRDADGRMVKCCCNWSGAYLLDLYNPQVVAYLERVFNVVLGEWGFDMVKLDFLYSADCVPCPDKTRGEQMCEAMELLRRLVGDKLILGCGVPLMPAFGLVDFCRTGCDATLDWDDKWFMKLVHRERVSTKNSILNTIYRRELDGRAFYNDPDVFFLRDENIRLDAETKLQLATVNSLLGSLRFTSDNYLLYDDKKLALYEKIMALRYNARLESVEDTRDSLTLKYRENGMDKRLTIDL